MTPTSVASSTPPTARSPTRCTCRHGHPQLHGRARRRLRRGRRRHHDRRATRSAPTRAASSSRTARPTSQAVFAKNLPFMLDLAKSAPTPDQPSSHIGAQIPDFVPAAFATSYGDPQTVEVNVRRALGAVTVKWQVERLRRRSRQAPTTEFDGGERYGQSGVYFHRMRGVGHRLQAPGDKVKVWFEAGGKTLGRRSRSPRPPLGRGNQRADPVAPRTTAGTSPNTAPAPARASSRPTPRRWPTPASPPTSTTSTPAAATTRTCSACSATTRPSSGTRALDDFVRDPGPDRRRLEDVRRPDDRGPRLPQRGRQGPGHRPARAPGRVVGVLLQPARALPGQAAVPFEHELATRPVGQLENCVQTSPTTSCSTGWARTRAANAGDDARRR